MVRLGSARTTTRATMQLSSLVRTGTTSKWFAMNPRPNTSNRENGMSYAMTPDPLLERICHELAAEKGAHTILLYGSRADGSANELSDYDLAAFSSVGRTARDTRIIDGHFLDIFLHPEGILALPTKEMLTLRGSVIITQRDQEATQFLAGLEELFRSGPEPLPEDEVRARDVWARKMVLRSQR